MAAYGDSDSAGDYEYDHFVPLELGGATNDPRNLWPELGASPNRKDSVENKLAAAVCAGDVSLVTAQHAIVRDWVLVPQSAETPHGVGSRRPEASSVPAGPASCSITASYSSYYNDWTVHVSSNQADQAVTVADTAGRAASWHTNSSGYAKVYLKTGRNASGEDITARVGRAICSTTL